ncbi:MAG: glutathione S-transferase family protein [Leptolyngbyaceae cyanobacterium SM1_4_3]|nr:glutathione S-transferase family protein [Leptolyngbyaceae cyanobacterium SM1_4_3]
MLELYYASESLCSQKVKLVLAEKNLEWKHHPLNLLTFENLQPDYIRLNPKGVVPTLIHKSQIITDSAIIIQYLDEQFPPQLTPAEPASVEQMHDWIDLQNQFPMLEVMYGNFRGIEGAILRRSVQIKARMLPHLMQSHPELREQYAKKLKVVEQLNFTIRDVREMKSINAKIEPLLDQLEAQLSETTWLCGTTYSLADTVWTAVLNRLNELGFGHFWQNDVRSAIASYFNRLKARPSFKTAIQDDKMPLPMLLSGLSKILLYVR